jgi:uncharacterized protein YbaR (Trm112 family)
MVFAHPDAETAFRIRKTCRGSAMTEQDEKKVDPKMLELLACPLTKGPLTWDAERGELVSKLARLAYPVRDGIPIMLPSEARRLEEEG